MDQNHEKLTKSKDRSEGKLGLFLVGFSILRGIKKIGGKFVINLDEDTIMDHADFNCLNWKEILSLIEKYHKVNSFLVGHDTLIYKNFILPKSLCYCLTRFGIYRTSASGRRGRKATERWKTH